MEEPLVDPHEDSELDEDLLRLRGLVKDFLRYRVCGMFYTDRVLDLRGAMKKVRQSKRKSTLPCWCILNRRAACFRSSSDTLSCP